MVVRDDVPGVDLSCCCAAAIRFVVAVYMKAFFVTTNEYELKRT